MANQSNTFYIPYYIYFLYGCGKPFSYLWDKVCSIFRGAGKFCLAHRLRQLTRDTLSDVNCLQTLLMRRNARPRMTFKVHHHTTLIVNILFKPSIFPILGKKNNKSSFFDADRDIPTLGSTYNAGNVVNLVYGIIPLPSDWDFFVCIRDRWKILFFKMFCVMEQIGSSEERIYIGSLHGESISPTISILFLAVVILIWICWIEEEN